MSELTTKDLAWFALANANATQEFYAFKKRFLTRYGTPDGFDLQKIERVCHTCDGSGMYAEREECHRCDGTGIYDVVEHWLQRFDLCGTIYHVPMTHADVYHLHVCKYPEPKTEYAGRITHRAVPAASAHRAFRHLLLRHEPMNFYKHVIEMWKWRGAAFRTKWYFRLIKLRNKMDLFKTIPEDDVPF